MSKTGPASVSTSKPRSRLTTAAKASRRRPSRCWKRSCAKAASRCPRNSSLSVVLLQLIVIHHPLEGGAVLRIGCVDAGKRVGKLIGVFYEAHGRPIRARRRWQLATRFEGLGQGVETPEPGCRDDHLAVDHLSSLALHSRLCL